MGEDGKTERMKEGDIKERKISFSAASTTHFSEKRKKDSEKKSQKQ